jgi:hypothetical protein
MVAQAKGKQYTMTELAFMREKYPTSTVQQLAEQLGRTVNGVSGAIQKFGISKKKDVEFAHEQFKLERVLKLMNILRKRRLTALMIADEFSVSERTAYRYIALLISIGVKIEKKGHTYKIEDAKCPFCGHDHTTNNPLL